MIDILRATAETYPEASAIDDGSGALSYAELIDVVADQAAKLRAAGVQSGDRVGLRIDSGSKQLYIAILAIMQARAAYVPVDVDDSDERARLVFGEAQVVGIIGNSGDVPRKSLGRFAEGRRCHAPLGRGLRRCRGEPVLAG